MRLILRATLVEHVADADPSKRWWGRWLEIVEKGAVPTEPRWKFCDTRFETMCSAIMSDIQSVEGSGTDFLRAIRTVEADSTKVIEADGNAWVAHIAADQVYFEGLFEQGEGGNVSLAQYKLAVETYVRFLKDPEQRTIEVEFPEH